MTTPAAKHFDTIASSYDSYKSPTNLYYTILKQAVKEHIILPFPTILDVGCGTGNMLQFLRPKQGMGIDISSQMIKVAKRKYKNNHSLRFQVHNIEAKSIQKNFDYILFNDVIEHIARPDKAIKNLSQSMKLKTTLILSMANPFWEPILLFLEYVHLKMPEGPHVRISESTLLQLLRTYKLRVLSKKTYFPRINMPLIKNWGLIYVYTIQKSA